MKSFQEKVLFLAKKIPPGKVATYGQIARILKTSPRAVGRALSKNPYPIKIPCHRVVKSDGSLGGYSGGVKKKVSLLREEGVSIRKNKIINFVQAIYKFNKKDK
jgi:methylated-DNA-[protein]-cysteine S-methyltransferase